LFDFAENVGFDVKMLKKLSELNDQERCKNELHLAWIDQFIEKMLRKPDKQPEAD
jgi:uncharacterized protein (UPF0335 family)